ncbi:MAG: glycosyltransferase family 39 protein [Methyloceanibacter sp.]|jgi:4-amino-4-deoxy-L-arabinose transferase-like glycosyltransferase
MAQTTSDPTTLDSDVMAQPGTFRWLALLIAFVTIWTLYSVVSAAPASIHNDMAEAYVWGREFRLGYFQHPPFWAWIAGVWFELFPRADWAFSLLSTLNAGLGLLGSWMLIGDFAEGNRRLAATALLLLTPFYTFLALKYNANSIFLSLWPWTMHFFLRSIENRRVVDAILFGLFIGLAMLSKYFALILAATCLIAALAHPKRRAYFASASPYASFLVAAVLFAPHVWWLARNDAPPLHYFISKTGFGLPTAILSAFGLLVGVVAFHSIVIALISITVDFRPRRLLGTVRSRWQDPRFRVLAILALLPLCLTILAAVLFHLMPSTNMTIGIFSLVPLFLLELADSREDRQLYRRSCALAVYLTIAAIVLSPAIAIVKFSLASDNNYIEPRKELAQEATQIWHEVTGSPLQFVGGSQRYENAVAFYSPDRPHGFIHLDFNRAPWVTSEDLTRSGFLAICEANDQKCRAESDSVPMPYKSERKLTLSHWFEGHSARPVTFIVMVAPPRR